MKEETFFDIARIRHDPPTRKVQMDYMLKEEIANKLGWFQRGKEHVPCKGNLIADDIIDRCIKQDIAFAILPDTQFPWKERRATLDGTVTVYHVPSMLMLSLIERHATEVSGRPNPNWKTVKQAFNIIFPYDYGKQAADAEEEEQEEPQEESENEY